MFKFRPLAAALVLSACTMSNADALAVDWKLYGFVPVVQRSESYCFYDERGIARQPGDMVRVWTKCILQKKLDAFDMKNEAWVSVRDMAASRMAHYYFPPMLKVKKMTKDQIYAAIYYETVADIANISPDSQIFYELDCHNRKVRELAIYLGKHSSNAVLPWKDVPPESNGANLTAMICPL